MTNLIIILLLAAAGVGIKALAKHIVQVIDNYGYNDGKF